MHEITWEEKIRLVELANKYKDSKEELEKFKDYVLDFLMFFDVQAWEMFITSVDITSINKEDIYFWNKINEELIHIKEDNLDNFTLPTQIRINLFNEIISKLVKENTFLITKPFFLNTKTEHISLEEKYNAKHLKFNVEYSENCPHCKVEQDFCDYGYIVDFVRYPKYFNSNSGHSCDGTYYYWEELFRCKSCLGYYYIENGT